MMCGCVCGVCVVGECGVFDVGVCVGFWGGCLYGVRVCVWFVYCVCCLCDVCVFVVCVVSVGWVVSVCCFVV